MKNEQKIRFIDGTVSVQNNDGSKVFISEDEFNKKFKILDKKKKQDLGFGFCTCGYPLQRVDKDTEDLCCFAEAYCEHETGIIKRH